MTKISLQEKIKFDVWMNPHNSTSTYLEGSPSLIMSVQVHQGMFSIFIAIISPLLSTFMFFLNVVYPSSLYFFFADNFVSHNVIISRFRCDIMHFKPFDFYSSPLELLNNYFIVLFMFLLLFLLCLNLLFFTFCLLSLDQLFTSLSNFV